MSASTKESEFAIQMSNHTDLNVLLENIEERANSARSGPWRVIPVGGHNYHKAVCQERGRGVAVSFLRSAYYRTDLPWTLEENDANLAFIAASRTDVPALVEVVKIAIDGLSGNYGPLKSDRDAALRDMERVLNRKAI